METTTSILASDSAPAVRLISFGFLHGPTPDADLILDVRRWLHDPAAAKAILDLDGRDARVQQTVYGTPGAVELVDHAVQAATVAHRGAPRSRCLRIFARIVVGADPGYPRAADVRMLCQLAQPGMSVYASLDDTLAAVLDVLPQAGRPALAAA